MTLTTGRGLLEAKTIAKFDRKLICLYTVFTQFTEQTGLPGFT